MKNILKDFEETSPRARKKSQTKYKFPSEDKQEVQLTSDEIIESKLKTAEKLEEMKKKGKAVEHSKEVEGIKMEELDDMKIVKKRQQSIVKKMQKKTLNT